MSSPTLNYFCWPSITRATSEWFGCFNWDSFCFISRRHPASCYHSPCCPRTSFAAASWFVFSPNSKTSAIFVRCAAEHPRRSHASATSPASIGHSCAPAKCATGGWIPFPELFLFRNIRFNCPRHFRAVRNPGLFHQLRSWIRRIRRLDRSLVEKFVAYCVGISSAPILFNIGRLLTVSPMLTSGN